MPDDITGKKIEKHFYGIAKCLFSNYCIQCGGNNQKKYYYFAEIEFYYYDKDKFNEKWNWVTYPRTNKSAGELFFHYSGFDICFESHFEKGRFGGILIRSLKNEEGKFITGPSVCSLEVLNACSKTKKWPEIVLIPEEKVSEKCSMNDDSTVRYGIEYENSDIEDKSWCFYDKQLYEKHTAKEKYSECFENASWDFDKKHDGKNPKPTKLTRYYNRFKPKAIK